MRSPQQALQDALDSGAIAAFIAGKEIDVKRSNEDWKPFTRRHDSLAEPAFAYPGAHWRPTPTSLPEPPPSERYHNPDNLTPEQVGEGYRLLLESEIKERSSLDFIDMWHTGKWWPLGEGSMQHISYRVPASTPFHWERPVRVPRPATDFIGGSLMLRESEYATVIKVIHDRVTYWHYSDTVEVSTATLAKSDTILIRLANATEFVPCYLEQSPPAIP